jgi:hypothetical protein
MDGKTCRNRRSGIASARTGRPRVGELSSNSPAICHGARRGAQKRGRRGVATTGEKITYPRLLQRSYLCRALLIEGVVDRGVRMTEWGAVPDNGIAMERREAQGSSPGPARHGAGLASLPRKLGANGGPIARSASRGPRKPPGASRRSIPSCRGEKENRDTGQPAARKSNDRPAERWLAPHRALSKSNENSEGARGRKDDESPAAAQARHARRSRGRR